MVAVIVPEEPIKNLSVEDGLLPKISDCVVLSYLISPALVPSAERYNIGL